MNNNVINFLCKKYNFGYAFFNEDFRIIAYSNIELNTKSMDIRDHFLELVGLEDEIKNIKNSHKPLTLSMIKKGDNYYDIDLEYVEDKKGYLIYMQLKGSDIEKYTKSIQDSNEQLLLESMSQEQEEITSDAIVALVENQKIVSINDKFSEFFDITSDEILGKDLKEFFKQKRALFFKTNTYVAVDPSKKKHLFDTKIFDLTNKNTTQTLYVFDNMKK
jgi:transcriptional regulator with PAS, ATPase and Fis domain